jgi:hypothetical protein
MLKHFFLGLLFFVVCSTQAQLIRSKAESGFLKKNTEKDIYENAELFFVEEDYENALTEYSKLEPNYPEQPELIFKIAVCLMVKSDGIEKSYLYFKRLDREKFKKLDYDFYYGKSLHLNSMFDEAITELTKYNEGGKKKRYFDEANKIIGYCNNAKALTKDHTELTINNLEKPINTANSEYVPLINADESMLIFTYRGERSMGGLQNPIVNPESSTGEYYEDVFYCIKDSLGNWTEPQPIPGEINTKENEACVSLSSDGQTLYIFESTELDEGAIYESKLEGTEWGKPTRLFGDINSLSWEGSISVTADGKTAYFSSERPGGKGGKDLYIAHLLEDGSWGNVKNMGDSINTSFDEDAPYIHPSGEFFIFSSTGHNSIGYYDIFESNITDDTVFSKAINLGTPLNTPGNDVFYTLTTNGKHGYYSSGKSRGYGKQDIYRVEPGYVGDEITLVLVKGEVTLDDKPIQVNVNLINTSKNKIQGSYLTNSASGSYMISVPKGQQYSLEFEFEKFEKQTRILNTDSVKGFFETTIDVDFYTPAYLAELRRKADSVQSAEVKANLGKEQYRLNEILAIYGDYESPYLTYTIQIAAFNLSENFDYSKLLKVGKIKKQKLDDGITRFVIGEFKTLEEAEEFRTEIFAAGINDAFITGIYKGKRYLLNELVHAYFFSGK